MEDVSWLLSRWSLIMLRAFGVFLPFLLVFWVWKPAFLQGFRIQQPRVVAPRFLADCLATVFGLSVYLIPLYGLFVLKRDFGYTKMYTDISEYGVAYFLFSFLLFAVINDTWFYWAHRAMHTFAPFKTIHEWHHRSYNITPLSSYSFHPGEAILDMIPYALVVFFIPFHPAVLSSFGLFGIFNNSYIHLGYDIPLTWREKFPPLKLFYTARHHALHHHQYNYNFAVNFMFWDRVMGTERTPE